MGRFSPTVSYYAGNEIGQGLERGVENFFRMQEMKRRRKEEEAERPIMEALRLAEMRRMGVRHGGEILDEELGGLRPQMMPSGPPNVPTSVNNHAMGLMPGGPIRGRGGYQPFDESPRGEIPKTALDAAERRTALRRDPTLQSSMSAPTVRTPTMTVADQNVGPSMNRLPKEPDEPHPGYQKLGDTGFYYDETVTPDYQRERQRRMQERELTSALMGYGASEQEAALIRNVPQVADNILFPEHRKPLPIGERIATRVQELTSQGMDLRRANEQARMEYGEAVAREPVDRGGSERSFTQGMRLMDAYRADQTIKNAAQMAEGYARLVSMAEDPSPAGDIGVIFGFMKMQDPNSTVREGEYATAENSGSIPERLRAQYNRLLTEGGRLSTAQRADFLRQAERSVAAQRSLVKAKQTHFSGLAQRYGVDPRDVVFDPFEGTPSRPQTPTQGMDSQAKAQEVIRRIRSGRATLDQALQSPSLSDDVKNLVRQMAGSQP